VNPRPGPLVPRVRHDERGQILILAAFSMIAILGFTAFVVDFGFLVYAQRTLQASADAAAAAGALDLPDDTKGANAALLYSGGASGLNKKTNLPTVTVTSASSCNAALVAQSLPCVTLINKRAGSPTTANLFTVTQQVTVPMFFAKVLGVASVPLTAVAKAGMRGGLRPLNVMVVVDTTASPAPAPANFLEGASDGQYGYNSCRVPWRIATDYLVSGDARAKTAIQKMDAWIMSEANHDPSNILDGYTLSGGKGAGQSGPSSAFSSPFGVAAMLGSDQAWLDAIWSSRHIDEGYYADSITMLCMIVMSGNWCTP